eukprot:COSAG01_NODE_386_length_17742_cov_25.176654_4_plen_77_part_00
MYDNVIMYDECVYNTYMHAYRRAAFSSAGGVGSMVQLLQTYHDHPDSAITVNVADTLRLLALGKIGYQRVEDACPS